MRNGFLKKFLSVLILAAFGLTSALPPSYAQSAFNLPQPGKMVPLSAVFEPALMVGLQIDPQDPFRMDFLIDRGQQTLTDEQKQAEYRKLVKYFLASLAIPNEDMWVNLSPLEHDRIIPDSFGLTEMGGDLLAQDYILKQIMSSLIYPEGDVGKKFWQKVYANASAKYGTIDIPLDMYNKVWIVADRAVISQKKDTAFLVESHLKVMLETDYLATKENAGGRQGDAVPQEGAQELAKEVAREIIIPALEEEVNTGENFARLRQIFSGMIMATWFKRSLKESVLAKGYANKAKVAGVRISEEGFKDRIYAQYLEAYKLGVFNFIKEELDPFTEEIIPRKYFSGGITAPQEIMIDNSEARQAAFARDHQGDLDRAQVRLDQSGVKQAGEKGSVAKVARNAVFAARLMASPLDWMVKLTFRRHYSDDWNKKKRLMPGAEKRKAAYGLLRRNGLITFKTFFSLHELVKHMGHPQYGPIFMRMVENKGITRDTVQAAIRYFDYFERHFLTIEDARKKEHQERYQRGAEHDAVIDAHLELLDRFERAGYFVKASPEIFKELFQLHGESRYTVMSNRTCSSFYVNLALELTRPEVFDMTLPEWLEVSRNLRPRTVPVDRDSNSTWSHRWAEIANREIDVIRNIIDSGLVTKANMKVFYTFLTGYFSLGLDVFQHVISNDTLRGLLGSYPQSMKKTDPFWDLITRAPSFYPGLSREQAIERVSRDIIRGVESLGGVAALTEENVRPLLERLNMEGKESAKAIVSGAMEAFGPDSIVSGLPDYLQVRSLIERAGPAGSKAMEEAYWGLAERFGVPDQYGVKEFSLDVFREFFEQHADVTSLSPEVHRYLQYAGMYAQDLDYFVGLMKGFDQPGLVPYLSAENWSPADKEIFKLLMDLFKKELSHYANPGGELSSLRSFGLEWLIARLESKQSEYDYSKFKSNYGVLVRRSKAVATTMVLRQIKKVHEFGDFYHRSMEKTVPVWKMGDNSSYINTLNGFSIRNARAAISSLSETLDMNPEVFDVVFNAVEESAGTPDLFNMLMVLGELVKGAKPGVAPLMGEGRIVWLLGLLGKEGVTDADTEALAQLIDGLSAHRSSLAPSEFAVIKDVFVQKGHPMLLYRSLGNLIAAGGGVEGQRFLLDQLRPGASEEMETALAPCLRKAFALPGASQAFEDISVLIRQSLFNRNKEYQDTVDDVALRNKKVIPMVLRALYAEGISPNVVLLSSGKEALPEIVNLIRSLTPDEPGLMEFALNVLFYRLSRSADLSDNERGGYAPWIIKDHPLFREMSGALTPAFWSGIVSQKETWLLVKFLMESAVNLTSREKDVLSGIIAARYTRFSYGVKYVTDIYDAAKQKNISLQNNGADLIDYTRFFRHFSNVVFQGFITTSDREKYGTEIQQAQEQMIKGGLYSKIKDEVAKTDISDVKQYIFDLYQLAAPDIRQVGRETLMNLFDLGINQEAEWQKQMVELIKGIDLQQARLMEDLQNKGNSLRFRADLSVGAYKKKQGAVLTLDGIGSFLGELLDARLPDALLKGEGESAEAYTARINEDLVQSFQPLEKEDRTAFLARVRLKVFQWLSVNEAVQAKVQEIRGGLDKAPYPALDSFREFLHITVEDLLLALPVDEKTEKVLAQMLQQGARKDVPALQAADIARRFTKVVHTALAKEHGYDYMRYKKGYADVGNKAGIEDEFRNMVEAYPLVYADTPGAAQAVVKKWEDVVAQVSKYDQQVGAVLQGIIDRKVEEGKGFLLAEKVVDRTRASNEAFFTEFQDKLSGQEEDAFMSIWVSSLRHTKVALTAREADSRWAALIRSQKDGVPVFSKGEQDKMARILEKESANIMALIDKPVSRLNSALFQDVLFDVTSNKDKFEFDDTADKEIITFDMQKTAFDALYGTVVSICTFNDKDLLKSRKFVPLAFKSGDAIVGYADLHFLKNSAGKKVLVVAAINPTPDYLAQHDPKKLFDLVMEQVVKIAKLFNMDQVGIEPSAGVISNRAQILKVIQALRLPSEHLGYGHPVGASYKTDRYMVYKDGITPRKANVKSEREKLVDQIRGVQQLVYPSVDDVWDPADVEEVLFSRKNVAVIDQDAEGNFRGYIAATPFATANKREKKDGLDLRSYDLRGHSTKKTLYIEEILINPRQEDRRLFMKLWRDFVKAAKDKGYDSVFMHARMENGLSDIIEKRFAGSVIAFAAEENSGYKGEKTKPLFIPLPKDQPEAAGRVDRAASGEDVGGIDLNEKNLDLQTRGDQIEFDLPSQWEGVDFDNVQGLDPVIFNISPIEDAAAMLRQI